MIQRVKCVFVFLLVELNRGYSSYSIFGYFNTLAFFDMVLYLTLIDAQDSQFETRLFAVRF